MPTFEIRYIKKLCDDTGHEHAACQSIITVTAPNAHEALRLAEAEVCGSRHLSDWTIFADAVELRAASSLRAVTKTDISFADPCACSK
jgi:hypothetical protein